MVLLSTHQWRLDGTEWGVLLYGLPNLVSTKTASQSSTYYILKQTHEPVLRTDNGNIYYSHILRAWKRSPDSSSYLLCPNTDLWFNKSVRLTAEIFFSHIKKITRDFDPKAEVSRINECVQIKFSRNRRDYLEYLSAYQNAPSISRTKEIEDGLGPFHVVSISKDKIALERNSPRADGYNKVVFYEYKGSRDSNLENRNIKDFNLIPSFDVPNWVGQVQYNVDMVELRSVSLIINIPDLETRKAVYNCVPVAKLRSTLFPQKKNFFEIKTILPTGMAGAVAGMPEQHCEQYKGKIKKKIVFANWNADSQKSLEEFAHEMRKKSGLNLEILPYSPAELEKQFRTNPKRYDLVVVVEDAIRPNFTAFFPSFVINPGYYGFSRQPLENDYHALLEEENTGKQAEAAARLAKRLGDEALVLPLFQTIKASYYPKEIKNLDVGNGFLQYPEVASLSI